MRNIHTGNTGIIMGKAGTLLFLALVMASLGVAVALSVSMLIDFFL